MALKRSPNIPTSLLDRDEKTRVAFFQTLLDYRNALIQTGMRIKWKSTVAPAGGYLILDGSVVTNADYLALVAYAANDADFVVGATTTTLPTDAGFYVKT